MPAERVVVAGSGVTGLACAAGFAQLGCPVVLCGDEPPPFDIANDHDLRVFALNDASCGLLQRLGVWDAVAAQRLCRYETMEVWSGRGRVTFHATDVARTHLGVIAENGLLCSVLFEHLRGCRDVEIRCPARFESMQPAAGEGGLRVAFDDGGDVEAGLVVGADGADSQVRTQAGIGYERHPYSQDAIVATVECEAAHGNACLQRFSDEGVTAFLPFAEDHLGSIVWSCARPLADELAALSRESFGARLTRVLERRLGAVAPVSARVAFPLYGALAGDYMSEGVALVGDAAHSVHPLAGQGANMGLADVRALLDAVPGGVRGEDDRGIRWTALRRYQRSVKGRNLGMKRGLEAIHWWFAGGRLPPRVLREAGLVFVDRCLPLKTRFMDAAAGLEKSGPSQATPRAGPAR